MFNGCITFVAITETYLSYYISTCLVFFSPAILWRSRIAFNWPYHLLLQFKVARTFFTPDPLARFTVRVVLNHLRAPQAVDSAIFVAFVISKADHIGFSICLCRINLRLASSNACYSKFSMISAQMFMRITHVCCQMIFTKSKISILSTRCRFTE